MILNAMSMQISGKTSFLLTGTNCGRGKIRDAREKGTRVIDENGLFALVAASIPFAPPLPSSIANAASGFLRAFDERAEAARMQQGGSAGGEAGPSSSSRPHPHPHPPRPVPVVLRPPSATASGSESMLWVDKHKPKTSQDLIGEQHDMA